MDATHLTRSQRAQIRDSAKRAGVPCIIVESHSPKEVLEARVAERASQGRGVSEAELEILKRQLETMELVAPHEADAIIDVDTSAKIDFDVLVARILEARRPGEQRPAREL